MRASAGGDRLGMADPHRGGLVQRSCATPTHPVPSGRSVSQVSASLPSSIGLIFILPDLLRWACFGVQPLECKSKPSAVVSERVIVYENAKYRADPYGRQQFL